jgi:hypothetical protein
MVMAPNVHLPVTGRSSGKIKLQVLEELRVLLLTNRGCLYAEMDKRLLVYTALDHKLRFFRKTEGAICDRGYYIIVKNHMWLNNTIKEFM